MTKRNAEAKLRRDEQLKAKNVAIKAQREEKQKELARRREEAAARKAEEQSKIAAEKAHKASILKSNSESPFPYKKQDTQKSAKR